ncbi:chaperonin-containing T-complex member BBS12 [Ranitomeya variabilis]|uniref:chaperonin-containing T-complex member BBS12 n=1 Tax=Ranitomeya variabilis TaxID=490064 RepID=UPI004057226B
MSTMKLRGHLGLVELCNLSSSVKTFLGPQKSYKFIYDPDTQESSLTCSAFRLLESLDLSSAVGQLLNETIQAHHKAYKTATTTLFFLVGVWSKAVLECLHHGVPISLIVSIMVEGLNSCIESLEALHIPIHNVLATKQISSHKTYVPDGRSDSVYNHETHCVSSSRSETFDLKCLEHIPNTVKNVDIIPSSRGNINSKLCQMSKLSHSRHFSIPKVSNFQDPSQTSCHSLENLTKSLSHGNWEAMELVEKAATLMLENTPEIFVTKDLFKASYVNICILRCLSELNSSATFGYVTLVRPEYATIVKKFEGKPLRVLLLDGELTEKYRHLGFNMATNLKLVSKFADHVSSSKESWIDKACQKIVQANINLILVRDDACPQLIMQCIHRNILIITHVKPNVLQAFSDSTGAEIVTYLTQVTDHSIGCEVFAKIFPQGSSNQTVAVNLHAHGINLVTVVQSCRLYPKMQVMEDQFWTCSYKLYDALLDQKVFPGGGAVELFCLNHLQKLEKTLVPSSSIIRGSLSCTSSWLSSSVVDYQSFVYKCFANGWVKYLSTLLFNMGEYSSELQALTIIQNELKNISASSSPSSYVFNEYFKKVLKGEREFLTDHRLVTVYDNVIPKVEAWRSALHLVHIVLQTDAEIITGFTTPKQATTGQFVSDDYQFL